MSPAELGADAPVLTTARLSLREIRAADAEFVLGLLNGTDYKRYIGDRGLRSIHDAEVYIEQRIQPAYRDDGFGMWLVSDAADHPVGICGLVNRDYLDDVDLGYAFLPEVTGRGYATEAARGVLEYAHHRLRLERVVAITALENPPSIKVLHKLGYRFSRLVDFPGDSDGARLFEKPVQETLIEST